MRKGIIIALASSTLFASSGSKIYEIAPTIGGMKPEGNTEMKHSLNYGLRFGVKTKEYIFDKIEVGLEHAPRVKFKKDPGKYDNSKTNASRFYANIVKEYDIFPKTSLYALVGVGYEFYSKKSPNYKNHDDGFGHYGAGVKYAINDSLSIIAEVRHAITFRGYNGLFYNLGLSIPFGPAAKAEPVAKSVTKTPVETKAPVAPKTTSSIDYNEQIPVPAPAPMPDSDGDGVPDGYDKCPNTPAGVKVDAFGCPLTITLRVEFGFDKSSIDGKYLDKIEEVAQFLQRYPQFQVKLEGHTDNIGSKAYNQKLSQDRAVAVLNELEKLGVKRDRMSYEGFGMEKPVADNGTEEGRALNRRVEAKFKD